MKTSTLVIIPTVLFFVVLGVLVFGFTNDVGGEDVVEVDCFLTEYWDGTKCVPVDFETSIDSYELEDPLCIGGRGMIKNENCEVIGKYDVSTGLPIVENKEQCDMLEGNWDEEQKICNSKYSETAIDNPYNNELIIYQKDNFVPLQYDKTKQVVDETFLSKTVEEWQKVSRNTLMQEHDKYLPEHKFFDHLGSFLIKNEFQNMMNEFNIVNVEDDFQVKGGMSLTSLPPHNSYYSIIKATDGNYYRFQGGTHANQVNVYKVSALLFFDTSVDFKMEDLVKENQLFTIMPESNTNSNMEPHNLIIHTNNSKVKFHNNTPEVIRIQDSGTGRVGEEHLLDWVGPTILPYTTSSMTFDEPGNYDFNARFAPNLENPLWWSTHVSGTVIVMSDDMNSVSREEKNKMAQSLLFDLGLPVVGAGTGNADNVLSVDLDPSIVESIPNATQYYKERIEQIFPFEIVVDMEG